MGGTDLSDCEIIVTPTLTWLKGKMSQCSSEITIASPFVNDGIWMFADIPNPHLKRSIVTRINVRDFAFGASSLSTLSKLVKDGWKIFSLPRIHAKIYIFDNSSALITSANSTHAGLTQNLECGITTDDPATIKNLRKTLLSGLGSDTKPVKLTSVELESLRAPVDLVEKTIKEIKEIENQLVYKFLSEPDESVISFYEKDEFLNAFKQWRRLTLEGIIKLQKTEFILRELYAVGLPMAQNQYPTNRFAKDKLRQQLQFLRDMGLIKFLGHGRYKCLFKFIQS